MKISSLLINQATPLRNKIKQYRHVVREIQRHLSRHPHEWGRFQSDFDSSGCPALWARAADCSTSPNAFLGEGIRAGGGDAIPKGTIEIIERSRPLTGLFDYLDYRILVRLVSKPRRLLAPGGALAISDVRYKFSNPSIYFMEWVADWSLIYRDDDEFRQIFLDSGFSADDLTCQYEQQGIMQYTVSRNQ